MLPGIDVFVTRGTIDVTAQMFVLLFRTNQQFLKRHTFALVGAHADMHGVCNFSLVRSAKVSLKAGLTIERTFTSITWK